MLKYRILTHKRVDKFLSSHSIIAKTFLTKLDILGNNPFSPILDTKPLKGLKNTWRLRIGKYRFLYTIEHDKILIFFFDADSRGDIY